MFDEQKIVKVYRVTVKKVIERLLELQNIDIENFVDDVKEQFDGYDYKDIEEVIGFDHWSDLKTDGKYELNVKVDHEDAYEFTLYVEVLNKKVTVINVL